VKSHHFLAVAGAILALSCSKEPPAESVAYTVFGEYVPSVEDSFPQIRYFESGLVAPNDRCAVRKVKLNVKMPPVYVNGRPIGFC
jgi:hypothetical protein